MTLFAYGAVLCVSETESTVVLPHIERSNGTKNNNNKSQIKQIEVKIHTYYHELKEDKSKSP